MIEVTQSYMRSCCHSWTSPVVFGLALLIGGSGAAAQQRSQGKAQSDAEWWEGVERTLQANVREDRDKWIKELLPKAQTGDMTAIYNLGTMYEDRYTSGGNDPADLANARKWLTRGIELLRSENRDDDSEQQTLIGMHYEKMHEYREAVSWYSRAASQGDWDAQSSLGVAYMFGHGVPKDEIEALARLYIGTASGKNLGHIRLRDDLEKKLGAENALKAQQRAKEIVREVEESKKVRKEPQGSSAPGSGR